jgi:hypothetical protein
MSHRPPAPTRGVALGKYRHDYPRFVVATDADSLLSSVDNDCRNGWHSRTVRIAEAGTARVFASAHVYDEVYRGMQKFPASSGIPVEVMQQHFESVYLAQLRFVEVPASIMRDEMAARVTHTNDVPTAALARAIAPAVVFSGDKHLRRPNIAPENWHVVAAAGIQVAVADEAQMGFGLAAGIPIVGGYQGMRWIAQLLDVPTALVATVAGALSWVALRDPERRATVARRIGPAANAIMELLIAVHTDQTRGMSAVRGAEIAAPTLQSLEQQLAAVLARSNEPMLAREVREHLLVSTLEPNVPSVPTIRATLASSSLFTSPVRHRWQLGAYRAPRG